MSEMRLQKFLARAGVASRRASETLITAGRVAVNGAVITQLGTKIDADNDQVTVDGVEVRLPDQTVTLMLHKPAGYVTTMHDPQRRPTVASLVPAEHYPGLYPIGRLDTDTTGLLLFTTDGELGQRLLHPRHHVMKHYVAQVKGILSESDLRVLQSGVLLDDGMTLPAEVELMDPAEAEALLGSVDSANTKQRRAKQRDGEKDKLKPISSVSIGIREGRKRQIRRMFEAVGHPVLRLHRQAVGALDLGTLPRGAWRQLDDKELAVLIGAESHDRV